MRIMIAGVWSWLQYEEAFARGLSNNGVEVFSFSIKEYFQGILGGFQQRIPLPGPAIQRLNRALIAESNRCRPDWILFWGPMHILPSTLQHLRSSGVRLVSYNNDDPFSPKRHGRIPWHHYALWYWYKRCLGLFDLNFLYRSINCTEAYEGGAKHAAILLPYFIPWKDRPLELAQEEVVRFQTEVVFVGHYESDGRERAIRALIHAGIQVRIWGGGYWNRSVLGDLYDTLAPIKPVHGDDYTRALSGAKICLCFLSRLNRDTYTRRCFEIPACGRVMLAERTDDLMRLFKEDEEVCFFSSSEELVAKAQWLLSNPDVRERIALAGMRRVWADGHDVQSRAREFIDALSIQTSVN